MDRVDLTDTEGATPRPPRSSRGHVRPWFVLGALVAALLVLAGLLVLLPLASGGDEAAPGAPAVRAAGQDEVQAALDGAARALRAGDRAAYCAALPASDAAARRARDELFDRLASLPWTRFAFDASPIPREPGRFDVFGAGMLGQVGPADRIAGNRVLDFKVIGERVVVTGDSSPPVVRRQYMMAFERPVAVRRPGGIVISDRSWRPLAVKVADDLATARARIAATGIKPGAPLAVYLYSTSRQLRAALGGGPSESRIRFFSVGVDRLASEPWKTRDVGVLAPRLAGQDAWRPMMLSHELTHAYTMSWFAGTEHAPTLLVEGLATMVEGGRSFAPLRADLAAPQPELPLVTAIAMGSLWSGNSTERVHLAYLEGSSLVSYVVQRWGLATLKEWAQAVADSNLTREGLDASTRETLRVSWSELEAGWKHYVYTLP